MDFIFFAAELSGGTLAVDVGAHGVVGLIDPQNPLPPRPTKLLLDAIDPQTPLPPRPTK
jgi:hypothetical protein